MNASRFYIYSLFPCLQAVISKINHQILFKNFPSIFHWPYQWLRHIKIHVNGSEFGRTPTNEGSGFVVHNEASPNPPPSRGKQLCLPVWDETSSSYSRSSNIFDKKQPVKDNSSIAQEQTMTGFYPSPQILLVLYTCE